MYRESVSKAIQWLIFWFFKYKSKWVILQQSQKKKQIYPKGIVPSKSQFMLTLELSGQWYGLKSIHMLVNMMKTFTLL